MTKAKTPVGPAIEHPAGVIAPILAELEQLQAAERTAFTKARSAPAVIEHRAKLAAYAEAINIVRRYLPE